MKRDSVGWVLSHFLESPCPRCSIVPALKQGHECATPWVDRWRFLELTHEAHGCTCGASRCALETYRPRLRIVRGGGGDGAHRRRPHLHLVASPSPDAGQNREDR